MTAPSANHRAAAGMILALALLAPMTAAAQPTQSRPVVEAYNETGQALFRSFAGQPGNIVFSPYSIGTAMAMVLSGARGATQAEMRKALHHELPAAEIDAANAQLLATLRASNDASPKCPEGFALDGQTCAAPAPKDKDEDCPRDARRAEGLCVVDASPAAAKLRIANALMLVNAAATVAPAFAGTMRDSYDAEIFRGATLETVNAWAKEKTEGKIDRILERLNPNDSHVLLNAVYFNAPWTHAFPKSATREREFRLTETETVEVPTMSQQSEFAVVKGEGYSAIRLPYAADGLSMAIVRPDAVDGLDRLIAGFDVAKVRVLLRALQDAPGRTVSLSLPRFKTQFEAELIEPFKRLGMHIVFDPARSDLSGLTGLPRTEAQSAIDQIVHRAVIEVTEEGTEAAAVTAVVVTTRTMRPDDTEKFQVDRPFMFLITDDKTGAILFEGRIVDPRN